MYIDESKYGTQSTNHHDDYKSICFEFGLNEEPKKQNRKTITTSSIQQRRKMTTLNQYSNECAIWLIFFISFLFDAAMYWMHVCSVTKVFVHLVGFFFFPF